MAALRLIDYKTNSESEDTLAMNIDDEDKCKIPVTDTLGKVFFVNLDEPEPPTEQTSAKPPIHKTSSKDPSPLVQPEPPMDPVDQTEPPVETITLSREEILPIVTRCIQKISELQWNMLATETLDVSTVAVLIDVFTNIIQSLAAETLKITLKILEESRTADSGHFYVSLGDSLFGSIAWALGVPSEKCESAEQLTELVEMEVSERVNSALALANNSPVLPPEPAVYVSGTKFSIETLRRIVSHSAACLRRCAVRLSRLCCRQPYRYSHLDESIESIKSKISVPSVTNSMKGILEKWSSVSDVVSGEAQGVPPALSSTPSAERVAADILTTILHDMHICESGSGAASPKKSPRTHFNMGLIARKVQNFFSSAGTKITAREKQHGHFSKAAKRQFEKMISDLKNAWKKKDSEFLVDLKQRSDQSLIQSTDEELTLPGSVPQSPRLTPRATPSPSYLVVTPTQSSKDQASVEFDSIEPALDKLYDIFDQTGEAGKQRKVQERLNEQIRKLTRELTDKIYSHLMVGRTYYMPVAPPRRCLSDTVLSKINKPVVGTQLPSSPEVLYAMTEDVVGKYLQNILFCVQELSLETAHSEAVAGALEDISELFITITTPPEEPQIPAAQPSPGPGPSDAAGSASICRDDEAVVSTPVVALRPSESLCSLTSVYEESEPMTNFIAAPQPESKTSDLQSEVEAETSSLHPVISALLQMVITKSLAKSRKLFTIDDLQAVLKRLKKLPLDDIKIPGDGTIKKIDKIPKAIVKDLHRVFGSADKLMEAALTPEDPSFDHIVVNIFKKHVNAMAHPKKKPAVARFLSAVGRAFTRAFK